MARRSQTKAERKLAPAGGETKAERKQARVGGETKAERRQAMAGEQTKADLKEARARSKTKAARARAGGKRSALPGDDSSPEERIEWRLARIERAVAAQSERSEELLEKVGELLYETPESVEASPGSAPEASGGENGETPAN